ncbi:MAG: aminotransferase [Hyphomicrobiales bacterium]|nr:aminotransferase [Hyphomicrobiales bacterium]
MEFSINPLVLATEAPPIPIAQAWKARYHDQCGPLIDLSQAVPGHPPPMSLLCRLGEAASQPEASRYGPIVGDRALREALAVDISSCYDGRVAVEQVAITAGCNQAFFVAAQTLAKAGDAIVLPSPWYFNHKMALDMLGIEARPLACDPKNGFLPDPDACESLLDARVKAIVLVSPNNPSGAVYSETLISRFQALARRRGMALVLDETYRDFLPLSFNRAHGLFAEPDWDATLVHLYSFSKAYAIPGQRLGSIVAAPGFLAEAAKILDSLQICPPRSVQMAIVASIEETRDWRAGVRRELARRADACRAAFTKSRTWRLSSIGAYFAFVAHPYPDETAAAVAERLVVEAGVLGLPGPYFGPGLEGYLRLAFANVEQEMLVCLGERLAGLEP